MKLTPVGTATFTFADGNNGTFSYNVDLGDGVNKANQTKPITRQVFRPPGTVRADWRRSHDRRGYLEGNNGSGAAVAYRHS